MRTFSKLFLELDRTSSVSAKLDLLESYFRSVPPEDAAWALHFLCGLKRRRPVSSGRLREWAAAEAHLPLWLVEECYEKAGDLAETLALIVPPSNTSSDRPLHHWVEARLLPLSGAPENTQRESLIHAWRELDLPQRLVWNKLITGAFRVGVGRTLIVRALARVCGLAPAVLDHRLMGAWAPVREDYLRLLSSETVEAHQSQPYPFYLAYSLDESLDRLGDPAEWQLEWKWDGIRAQAIRRADLAMIWSRGEELITDSFPDLVRAIQDLPDGTVLDGEVVAWETNRPGDFHQLQRRLGRRRPSAKVQASVPVAFVAYDILEWDGQDIRSEPLASRRQRLESVFARWNQVSAHLGHLPRERIAVDSWTQPELFPTPAPPSRFVHEPPSSPIQLSQVLSWNSWEDLRGYRDRARSCFAEGVMLKRLASPYGAGRHRGDWWKYKVEPLRIDCVLVAAQVGHGRRAGLFTDYTFAVWSEGVLLPITKAYSGLTDDEIQRVDQFVKHNTTERFGPVRAVRPELVFEIACDSIRESGRHKAGISLRFPRMARWRHDKPAREADTLESVRRLLNPPQ